jgi:hypothetical protein
MTPNQIGTEMLDILVAAAIAVSSPQLAPVDDTTTITIQEDDPRWDCRTMGNRICGEGNSEGVAPGYYGEIDNDQ